MKRVRPAQRQAPTWTIFARVIVDSRVFRVLPLYDPGDEYRSSLSIAVASCRMTVGNRRFPADFDVRAWKQNPHGPCGFAPTLGLRAGNAAVSSARRPEETAS
jgi:hypothetical protein